MNAKKIMLWQAEREDCIQGHYFEWLMDLVGATKGDVTYLFLMRRLHSKEYYHVTAKDVNLYEYGNELRLQFVEEKDLFDDDKEFLLMPTSVLEVLIRLSQHGETLTVGNTMEVKMGILFWEMISNLGLEEFTDEFFFDRADVFEYIDAILDKWLGRKIKRNGKGGIFPLQSRVRDQRKEETWYQMQYYLEENYPV